MGLEVVDLPSETVWKCYIISVHAGNIVTAGYLETCIERNGASGSRLLDNSNTWIMERANAV